LFILLVIAGLWALYLVPLWMRSRGSVGRSSARGIGMPRGGIGGPSLRSTGGTLARSGGSLARGGASIGAALATVPRTSNEARRRRRDVLVALGGLAVVTLLLALLVGGALWVLHLLVDIALLGYGWLVHEHETRLRERADKVRPLRAQRPVGRPATGEPVTRRRAVNG
jgi:hypothetical protein